MNKLYLYIGIVFCVITLLGACEDKWDKHYHQGSGENSSVSPLTLYEYLKEQPEYTKFMAFLDEQGVGAELAKNQELTVWPVRNDAMPDNFDSYTDREKLRLAKHHINYMALTSPKLSDGKIIKTMAGKNVSFTTHEEGLALDGSPIVKANQVCANGVAHELERMMIPRDNIYEYIANRSDEYSIYRDSLLSKNDTVFDMNNSFPLGVDADGNTVYDSVFIIENPYFDAGDFRNDNGEFTLFLPDNNLITKAVDSITKDLGGVLLENEKSLIFDWIMKATIHDGMIREYAPDQSLPSLWGDDYDWRTSYQLVDPDYYEGSNGVIYEMEKLHIPRNLFVTPITFHVVNSYATLSNDEKELYFNIENETLLQPAWSSTGTWFRVERAVNDTVPLIVEMTVLTQNRFGKWIPARFFPGTYAFQGIVRPYSLGNWDIYMNDQLYLENSDPYLFNNANSTVLKAPVGPGFKIEPGQTATTLRLKFVKRIYNTTIATKRIPIQYFLFTPDASVY